MEYTNPWAPVVHLQNQGDYQQGKRSLLHYYFITLYILLKISAWEKMKEMPEFQAKLEKNPEMQRKVLSRIFSTRLSPFAMNNFLSNFSSFVDLNESGEYEAAFEEMIMSKIKKYGLETLENWGYELEPYFERSPWAPVIKLQAEGFLAEAWELMKELPEFQEKMNNPWIQAYYDQNEAGNYQEAHDRFEIYRLFIYKNFKCDWKQL